MTAYIITGARNGKHATVTLVQYFLGAIALVLLSSGRFTQPVWMLDTRSLLIISLIAGVYLAMVQVLLFWQSTERKATTARLLLVGSAAAMVVLVVYVVLLPDFSRAVLLGGLVLAFGLIFGMFWVRGREILKLGVLALLAFVGVSMQIALASGVWPPQNREPPQTTESHVNTSLYDLRVTSYRHVVPRPQTYQGGITLFGDGYLLVTGDGDLFAFQPSADRSKLEIERLAFKVPINTAEFAAAAGTAVNLSWFRVAGALAQQETPEGLRLFVFHHFWKVREQCWVVRVSELSGSSRDSFFRSDAMRWNTTFESAPCVPLSAGKDEPIRFSGIENGGRLALLDQDKLLITIGDHEIDGWSTAAMASQDPSSSYGKTILIDLRDHSSEIYSLGHRNPEGLYVSASGSIWLTEHGPQGGDELNLVRHGANYGWPLAAYGVEYGAHVWPLTSAPGRHDGYEQPYYAWTPSIGPSSLIEVAGPLFEYWQGDLLVASLVGQALWRLRIRENRVVAVEQIPMGARIRDILEGHDGEIVLWTSDDSIHFVGVGTGSGSGESLFRVCAGCHVATDKASKAVGPALQGVFGRRVASVPDFDYSIGLKTFGGTWTRERLHAFIQNPRSVVPGTSMHFGGIADDTSRTVLIEYLASPDSRLDQAPPAPF